MSYQQTQKPFVVPELSPEEKAYWQKRAAESMARIDAELASKGSSPAIPLLEAECLVDPDPELLEAAPEEPAPTPKRLHILSGADLSAPLQDPDWLVPTLQIGPGRPTCIAGYSFGGKTLTTQSMVLALLAGKSAWGYFKPSKREGKAPVRVLHLDQEQGRATIRRYQRLANGMGVEYATFDRLGVALFPELYASRSTTEQWKRETEGYDLVVLDALRGFIPGADENSSEVQDHIAKLTQVSTETGQTFIIIHHFGKSPQGKDSSRDEREQLRGSSGIISALGAVYAITGAKDEPKLVKQIKSHPDGSGRCVDDFYLNISDVPNGEDKYWGLHVGHVSGEEMARKIALEEATSPTPAKPKRGRPRKEVEPEAPKSPPVAVDYCGMAIAQARGIRP